MDGLVLLLILNDVISEIGIVHTKVTLGYSWACVPEITATSQIMYL